MDVYGRAHKSGVFYWGARWNHTGNRGASSLSCVGNVDMPVVRCFEEEAYQSRLFALVERHRATVRSPIVDLSLCVFRWQYDRLWFMDNRNHWARDIDAEFRLRNGISGLKAFVGWHNLEYFDMKSLFRRRYYVAVPDWWEKYEPSRFLLCPSPSVYAYHSFESLHGSEAEKSLVSAIAVSEFIVIATMCFLRCARDGVDFVSRAFDPRIRTGLDNRLGILTPLPKDLRGLIMSFNVFHIVRASSFDVALSLLELQRTAEIY